MGNSQGVRAMQEYDYNFTHSIFLGPALGSVLYEAGGFLLPFIVVGTWCMLGAIGILFTIPNVKQTDDQKDSQEDKGKK